MKFIAGIAVILLLIGSVFSASLIVSGNMERMVHGEGPQIENYEGIEKDFDIEKMIEDDYTPREPIRIDGNDEFHEKAAENGWPGDGSEEDPYIIEGYDIDGIFDNFHSSSIFIRNTDVHFEIRKNFLYDAWHPEPSRSSGAVSLRNVTNGVIRNNTIRRSIRGVILSSSYNNEVINNTLVNNGIGIFVRTSINNTIASNKIDSEGGNHWVGISLRDSENNIIAENLISNYDRIESRGISTSSGSKNNLIYHNILINNEVHASDRGNNTWNKDYPMGGNYWDDHTEPDEYSGPGQDEPGSDGIVDDPREIPGAQNVDRYPLTDPNFVSDLTVKPEEPEVGDEIEISVKVTNLDEQEGDRTVKFYMNDAFIDEVDVELDPGETETVTATYEIEEAGEHELKVEGMSTTFTVEEDTPDVWLISAIIVSFILLIIFVWKGIQGYRSGAEKPAVREKEKEASET